MPSSIEYCAGLFDGEGSIAGISTCSKNKPELAGSYAIHLSLGNRVLELTQAMQENFGGKIHPCSVHGRPFFDWRLTKAVDVLPCLEKLLPFLIGKKFEAEHAIVSLKASWLPYPSNRKGLPKFMPIELAIERKIAIDRLKHLKGIRDHYFVGSADAF